MTSALRILNHVFCTVGAMIVVIKGGRKYQRKTKMTNEPVVCVHPLEILIKYHVDEMTRIDKISIGDWIDLRVAQEVNMDKGDFKLLSLGISMQLPEGYEGHVVPRSSLFKKFGVIQANSYGVIDNSYCGDGDIWHFPAIALREVSIPFDSRICQFRIVKKQPEFIFKEVAHLGNDDRGGFGITGHE